MRAIEQHYSLRDTYTYAVPPRLQPMSVAREGVLAGTFAAAGVVLVFSVLDVRLADWLFTPTLLGTGIGHLLGIDVMATSATAAIVGYTAFHFAAFIALASLVAGVVRRAQQDARVLWAALLLVAVIELAFAGFVVLLGQMSYTASIAWPQLALGNLLGWLFLGGWMWRRHPELGAELGAALR